jgi:helix-turn-helix protein
MDTLASMKNRKPDYNEKRKEKKKLRHSLNHSNSCIHVHAPSAATCGIYHLP